MTWYFNGIAISLKIFQQYLMAIFNGFSQLHGILMAFNACLMACEYSSITVTETLSADQTLIIAKYPFVPSLGALF